MIVSLVGWDYTDRGIDRAASSGLGPRGPETTTSSAVLALAHRHLRDPVTEEEDLHHHGGSSRRGPLRRVATGILEVVMLDFMNALGFYLVVIFLPLYMQVRPGGCGG